MSEPSSPTVTRTLSLGRLVDLGASLAPLGRWGDDLTDRWDGRTLLRTLAETLDRPHVPYAVVITRPLATSMEIRLPSVTEVVADAAAKAVAGAFILDDGPLRDLCAMDRFVADLARRHSAVVPVLWRDPFNALVRSISAQQVNLRWATVVRSRIAQRFGVPMQVGRWRVWRHDADRVAGASVEELRSLQLTTAKSRSTLAVAHAARAGELRLAELERLGDDALIAHLTALPGIGRWSAEWFLARTLGRPRVVAGDLGVRKAVARLYGLHPLPSEDEVRRATEHWGAAATLAQTLALHDLAMQPSGRLSRAAPPRAL